MKTCENCHFWQQKNQEYFGECLIMSQNLKHTKHIDTMYNDHCGKWKSKEGKK